MSSVEVECSVCGLNGPPPVGCEICHGGAETQERGYTLSEQRSGRAPADEKRYGGESLNPKSSSLVVGGALGHPSHPQN